jgi:hypothetical protein
MIQMRAVLLLALATPLTGAALSTFATAVYEQDFAPELDYACTESATGSVAPVTSVCAGDRSWATAYADYGAVEAMGFVGAVWPVNGVSIARAEASFTDAVTFQGPFETGFALFFYETECHIDFTSGAISYVTLSAGNAGGCWFDHDTPTGPAEITFGEPFAFGATAVSIGSHNFGSRFGGVPGSAALQYILVTDAGGNPLPGVSLAPSEGGVLYPLHPLNLETGDLPPPLATPEPALSLVVALALGVLVRARRR